MQGVEAQTLANVYIALENDLEIIPVINKIDLPGSAARAPLESCDVIAAHILSKRNAHSCNALQCACSWPLEG